MGTIQADGTFQLGGLRTGESLPPGTYRVAVRAQEGEGGPMPDNKFASFESSGISFDVVQGRNEPFKITVERSKRGP